MKIFVYDKFNPEDMAMLQALYSRSADSVENHVKKVKETGSGKFMERFYVGYGHSSIADCGSTTVFIEGVSMLVAKAVQDWPLYSGQETSSRYIDMSKQKIIDPAGTKESKTILDDWMKFYTNSQDEVAKHLRSKYPIKPDEKEETYGRAINARVFDILRGFLPAGVTTQLSWHTNLRQAYDKLSLLKYYPLTEVQEVASNILKELQENYQHSFSQKEYEEQESYRKLLGQHTFYNEKDYKGDFNVKTTIDNGELKKYKDLLQKRPTKTNLPLFLSELGNITFEFLLDFGSFRDIQRHRNGVCRMPLLTTDYGFNEWYLNQLPDNLKKEAENLIEDQIKKIKELNISDEDKQYYVAMGFNVTCSVSYGLPATIYVLELRSGRSVHPSLRVVAHKMHEAVKKIFPDVLLHTDLDLDDWDIRRGLQDIKEK